jgi:hypothetical protein
MKKKERKVKKIKKSELKKIKGGRIHAVEMGERLPEYGKK